MINLNLWLNEILAYDGLFETLNKINANISYQVMFYSSYDE